MIKIQAFSFTKLHFSMSIAKRRRFCLDHNMWSVSHTGHFPVCNDLLNCITGSNLILRDYIIKNETNDLNIYAYELIWGCFGMHFGTISNGLFAVEIANYSFDFSRIFNVIKTVFFATTRTGPVNIRHLDSPEPWNFIMVWKDAITHLCPNINGGITKSSFKLQHG